jgi:4-hydroxy-tetrahydrodipicolinate synthase
MVVTSDHSWLAGIIADLPTPFRDDGSVDLVAFARLCERQICAGAEALLVTDTAAESPTLELHERAALIGTAVRTARGRARVIAGAGSNATARAIVLTRQAEAAGADAVMSVVPYYNRPTQDGIAAHFLAIAEATSLPIVLHDSPARAGRALSDATLLRLAPSSRFAGLRDDIADVARLARLRLLLPSAFRLLGGADAIALPWLCSGGDGCVSALANVTPQLMHGMYIAVRQRRFAYASTIRDTLAALLVTLACDETPSSLKYALSLRGPLSPRLRLPLVEPDADSKVAIAHVVDGIWPTPLAAMPGRLRG